MANGDRSGMVEVDEEVDDGLGFEDSDEDDEDEDEDEDGEPVLSTLHSLFCLFGFLSCSSLVEVN